MHCSITSEEFEISPQDLEFYRQLQIPIPHLSPLERQRRRICFRNFRSLYHRNCSATGKRLISMYHEQQSFPVFQQEYWWSDEWSPFDYAQEYDFSRSFFDQYRDLAAKVPRYAIANVRCENSIYSNQALDSKNCYLVFGCVRNQECYYGHIVWQSEHCLDCLYVYRCQWCSDCIDVVDSYSLHNSSECANCQESFFLYDCRGCKNCFGGVNLRNRQYCFMGKQLTAEQYHQAMAAVSPLTANKRAEMKDWLDLQIQSQVIFPEAYGLRNETARGNHIYESKDAFFCFDAKRVEQCRYCFTVEDLKLCYDVSFAGGGGAQNCCDCLSVTLSENLVCCHMLRGCYNAAYCEFCFDSHDLFGCHGLRHAEYCILNRAYSKQEYFELRSRIVAQMHSGGMWGEFFPAHLSPFAYNESIAQEYQPLTRSEVESRGLRWIESPEYSENLEERHYVPESISETFDSILGQQLRCRKSGKLYRILKQELEFYRQFGMALPEFCPDVRHELRMLRRLPRTLKMGSCARCNKSVVSSMFAVGAGRVFCEDCYLREVVA